MPSPNLSELITTTQRNRSGKLADNITDNIAILFRLKEKGRIRTFSGGRTIVEELLYADSTTQWYSGYETLNTSPVDQLTAAEFDIKQIASPCSISGLEELQNAGKEQVIDLLEARVEACEKSMMNAVATGMYATGTGNSGKEIGGLQYLVSTTPTTGTVGGINRATYTFWQNFARDSSDNSVTAGASTVQSEFNIVYSNIVRNTDSPDLILLDNTWWRHYLNSLQVIQRITNEKLGALGFVSLKYINADVVLDGGVQGNCPANTAYFLNTDYISYRPHARRNFVPIGGERMNTNQDAIVKFIGWAGNMTLRGGKFQAVLTV
jgi:hypothetical protein